MGMDLDTARRLVLKCLARPALSNGITFENLDNAVAHSFAQEQGQVTPPPSGDWRDFIGPAGQDLLHEVVCDLLVQRVLTVGHTGGYGWGNFRLTQFGSEVVKEQRFSPYDPDGYLKEFSQAAPKLHEICKLYATETLQCFRSGCYMASSVMLGAASEAAMDDLFLRIAGAMKQNSGFPEADAYEKKLAKEHSVYKRFELFKKHFAGMRAKVEKGLVEDLEGQLDGVFHLIRYYRNEAGHPTQTQVERMSAFRSLVLFIPYCKRIEELGDWLESHAEDLA